MAAAREKETAAETKPSANAPPTCCKDKMFMLMRRAILHSNGQVDYASVWHCLLCGRLVN